MKVQLKKTGPNTYRAIRSRDGMDFGMVKKEGQSYTFYTEDGPTFQTRTQAEMKAEIADMLADFE